MLCFLILAAASCLSRALQQTQLRSRISFSRHRSSLRVSTTDDFLSDLNQAKLPDFSEWREKLTDSPEGTTIKSINTPQSECAMTARLVTQNLETLPMLTTHEDEEDRKRQEEESRRMEHLNELREDGQSLHNEGRPETRSQSVPNLRSHHKHFNDRIGATHFGRSRQEHEGIRRQAFDLDREGCSKVQE